MFHCIFFTHKHDLCINNTKSLVIIESKHPFREISTDKNTNRHQRHKNYSRISVPFPPKVKSNAALREIRCRMFIKHKNITLNYNNTVNYTKNTRTVFTKKYILQNI